MPRVMVDPRVKPEDDDGEVSRPSSLPARRRPCPSHLGFLKIAFPANPPQFLKRTSLPVYPDEFSQSPSNRRLDGGQSGDFHGLGHQVVIKVDSHTHRTASRCMNRHHHLEGEDVRSY